MREEILFMIGLPLSSTFEYDISQNYNVRIVLSLNLSHHHHLPPLRYHYYYPL